MAKSFKYQPETLVEGDDFCEKFCDVCVHDLEFRQTGQNGCDILVNAIIHDVHDDKYPNEWTFKGTEPVCTAFKHVNVRSEPYRCDKTVDIFD